VCVCHYFFISFYSAEIQSHDTGCWRRCASPPRQREGGREGERETAGVDNGWMDGTNQIYVEAFAFLFIPGIEAMVGFILKQTFAICLNLI